MKGFECRCVDALSADGLATLAAGSIDVTITDPPYSERVHANSRKGSKVGGNISAAHDFKFPPITQAQIEELAGHFKRLTKRWVCVFSDVERAHFWRDALVEVGLDYIRTAFWIKRGAAPQFTGDRPGSHVEAIVIAHPRGRKRWNGGGRNNLFEYDDDLVFDAKIVRGQNPAEPRCHTAQKPLALMQHLVQLFSNPGETILDPFAGSGSTLEAAKKERRYALGFELDPTHAATAERRLRQVEFYMPVQEELVVGQFENRAS